MKDIAVLLSKKFCEQNGRDLADCVVYESPDEPGVWFLEGAGILARFTIETRERND